MRSSQKEARQFENWLQTDVREELVDLDTVIDPQTQQRKQANTNPQQRLELLNEALRNDQRVKVSLSGSLKGKIGSDRPNRVPASRLVVGDNQGGLSVANVNVHHLELTSIRATESPVMLDGCRISHLVVGNVDGLHIKNTWIGTISFQRPVTNLSVEGGGILLIDCASADAQNPFLGSVYFAHDVYFPRSPNKRLVDAQPYRNMRAHVMKLENAPMVNRFHILELAVERKQEGDSFTRFVSFAYEMLSSYGGSIARPAYIFFALLILTCAALYFQDAVAVRLETHDWMSGLARTSHWRAFERAGLLTLQGTLNPLGIFGTQSIVSPKYGWTTAWMFFHGIATATLAALFIVALRRRFKLS